MAKICVTGSNKRTHQISDHSTWCRQSVPPPYHTMPKYCTHLLIFSSQLGAADRFRCPPLQPANGGQLFFHDPNGDFYSSSSRMVGTPMSCNSSHVKSINLRWLHFRSACPSSSNWLDTWILFELSISTLTSWSRKCRSNHLSLTYLLRRCILTIYYGKSWCLSLPGLVCFCTMMIMLSLPGFLAWST